MAIHRNNKSIRRKYRPLLLVAALASLLAVGLLVDATGKFFRSMAESSLATYRPHVALVWCERALHFGRDDAATQLLYARAYLQLNMTFLAADSIEQAATLGAAPQQIAMYGTIIAAQRGDQTAIAQLLDFSGDGTLPLEANEALIRGTQMDADATRCNLILDNLERVGEVLPIVYYHRARNAEIREDYEQAAQSYAQAFKVQPHLTRAAVRAAIAFSKRREFEQAERILRSVRDSSYAAQVAVELANTLWEQNKLDEAQTVIQAALDSDPQELGVLYLQLDEFMDTDQAALVAARIEDSLEHSQAAVELAQRVLDYNFRSFEARTLLIKNLKILGRIEESEQLSKIQDQMIANRQRCRQLRLEIGDSPHDLDKQTELAELYWSTESVAEAKLMLSEILDSEPNFPRALQLLEKIRDEEERTSERFESIGSRSERRQ